MKRALNRAAGVWLQWALSILPRERREWGKAMAAELEAVQAGRERARFALGCLFFAVSSWARKRQGLVWIGRGLIAAGLWVISAVGAFVAIGLGDVPGFTLVAACLVYAIGGAFALLSLRILKSYAAFCAALAGAVYVYLLTASSTRWPNFYAAIAVEASALMVGLIIVSTLLMVLRDLDKAARDV